MEKPQPKSFRDKLYFPRNHRHHYPLLILMAIELPFTIVILTLTGIASHDLYQSKLWQDGADNGFNSAPDEVLYAMANYRPFKTPMVWNSFTTDFNLVLGVLSTFFLITKFPVHLMRIFYPPLSVFIHAGLFAVYIASASYQAGSDMSDPKHPQKGAPWYIAKSCNVAAHPDNIKYCKQAKALFAMTIIVIIIYFVETILSIHSCILTSEEKESRRERREEKRTMKEYEEEILKSPAMIPMTPGPMTPGPNTAGLHPLAPMAPQHFAFGPLGGPLGNGSDLPLRNNAGPANPTSASPNPSALHQESMETLATGTGSQAQAQVQPHTLFPPPKAVTK